MNGHVQFPRLAFGHLEQDGCTKEDAQGATVDVAITGVTGDRLCMSALKEQDSVQQLKTLISSALRKPESDQSLLLSNVHRLGGNRRLRSVLHNRSETSTLLVSQPAL